MERASARRIHRLSHGLEIALKRMTLNQRARTWIPASERKLVNAKLGRAALTTALTTTLTTFACPATSTTTFRAC
jgi:hypothetical protein